MSDETLHARLYELSSDPDAATENQPPCLPCLQQATQMDLIQTQLANIDATLLGMSETLTKVVGGLNAVGEQSNWIIEHASTVFAAFEQMREQFAKGGMMSLLKGGALNGNRE